MSGKATRSHPSPHSLRFVMQPFASYADAEGTLGSKAFSDVQSTLLASVADMLSLPFHVPGKAHMWHSDAQGLHYFCLVYLPNEIWFNLGTQTYLVRFSEMTGDALFCTGHKVQAPGRKSCVWSATQPCHSPLQTLYRFGKYILLCICSRLLSGLRNTF